MKKLLAATAALSALSLLAGCGGGDDTEAKDALAASLLEENEGGAAPMDLSEEQADCVAEGMVDGIGTDQLQEYGILTADNEVAEDPDSVEMSEGDAETVADTFIDCVDVMAMFEEGIAESTGDLTEEQQECISEAITEDMVRDLLVATFQGDAEAATQQLFEPLTACIAPQQ